VRWDTSGSERHTGAREPTEALDGEPAPRFLAPNSTFDRPTYPPSTQRTRVPMSSTDPRGPRTFKNAVPDPCCVSLVRGALDTESSGELVQLRAEPATRERARQTTTYSPWPSPLAGEVTAVVRQTPARAPTPLAPMHSTQREVAASALDVSRRARTRARPNTPCASSTHTDVSSAEYGR
jgi:hypothetical protein